MVLEPVDYRIFSKSKMMDNLVTQLAYRNETICIQGVCDFVIFHEQPNRVYVVF